MKKNELITHSMQFDSSIEDKIRSVEANLNALAVKNAKHFAKRNLPAPSGDNLAHYTGELKAGCEKLCADVFLQLQPAAHFPEAKIDAEFFKEKDEDLNNQISLLGDQNKNDEFDIQDFNPEMLLKSFRWAIISTSIMTVGEILFNTKAFEVTGENLLFSLILSISVSFAVLVFSHIIPLIYKGAKNEYQRRSIILISLFLACGLFTALAVFRSTYLASQDVHIQPFYFVIINLFFLVVSSMLSYLILPTWQEIKQNLQRLKSYKTVNKRKKEIEQLKNLKEAIRVEVKTETKKRIRIVSLANYAAERFRKMYWECVEVFKTTNLVYRTDKKTPDCFSANLPEPEINDVSFNLIIQNRKAQ